MEVRAVVLYRHCESLAGSLRRSPAHTEVVARRSWIADRTDDLERELAVVGLSAPRAELERRLGEHVASIAAQMRTSVHAARRYFTPETMRMLAQRFAEQLADEAPGLDLVGAPRDCPVPLAAAGAMIAGLTEVSRAAR